MKKFAFISRHVPTQGQIDLAVAQGITLEHVGDRDAFAINPDEFITFDGVIVVHPWAALQLARRGHTVGVFRNAARSVDGGPQTFEAAELLIQWSDRNPDLPDEFTTVVASQLVAINRLPGTRSCADGYVAAVGQVIYHPSHDEFLAVGRDKSGVYKIRLEPTGQDVGGDSTFTVVRA